MMLEINKKIKKNVGTISGRTNLLGNVYDPSETVHLLKYRRVGGRGGGKGLRLGQMGGRTWVKN